MKDLCLMWKKLSSQYEQIGTDLYYESNIHLQCSRLGIKNIGEMFKIKQSPKGAEKEGI